MGKDHLATIRCGGEVGMSAGLQSGNVRKVVARHTDQPGPDRLGRVACDVRAGSRFFMTESNHDLPRLRNPSADRRNPTRPYMHTFYAETLKPSHRFCHAYQDKWDRFGGTARAFSSIAAIRTFPAGSSLQVKTIRGTRITHRGMGDSPLSCDRLRYRLWQA